MIALSARAEVDVLVVGGGATGAGAAMDTVGYGVMVVATLLTVVSGWDYLRGALPILRGIRT